MLGRQRPWSGPGGTEERKGAVYGGGTPVPFDPLTRLVTRGVHRYVANPMQISACLLWAGLALLTESPSLLATVALALVYCVGLAAWDEGGAMERRFGEAWRRYRRQVRPWLPRWPGRRPARQAGAARAPSRLAAAGPRPDGRGRRP
jgi:hypothetical protein